MNYLRVAGAVAFFLVALWGWWGHRTADTLRVQKGEITEVANTNARIGRQFQALFQKAEAEKRQMVETHNGEVMDLWIASERNRKAGEQDAIRLLDQAAVYRDRNRNRKTIPYANVCEDRMANIDRYVTDYIQEVRDAEAH